MFDQGSGPPLIVVPGVQGRWEWLAPALRELQKRCRTISFTLCGDLRSGARFEAALGFENYIRQLDAVFVRSGLERAALCGVSYGGYIALRYAALRPDRVSSLVVASSPAPGWVPNEQQRRYIQSPWRSAPAFVATAPLRLWPEIRTAFDTWPERLGFVASHAMRIASAPTTPALMAARVRLLDNMDFAPDCALIKAPVLVMSGEDELDRIVPPAITKRYQALIPGAQYEKMERSGHIGFLTRPARFAEIVGEFIARNP